jgi:hypothetical protein
MKVPDDDTSRMSEEECPGSPDLESVLANESVGSAASHPALLVDATTPLVQVLQLMRRVTVAPSWSSATERWSASSRSAMC